MGLINIIVFAVGQGVEERTTLLGGGGEVALFYTLDISDSRPWQHSTESHSKGDQTMHDGAKQFHSFDEIFGSVARQN